MLQQSVTFLLKPVSLLSLFVARQGSFRYNENA
jgi:hypothetical protein